MMESAIAAPPAATAAVPTEAEPVETSPKGRGRPPGSSPAHALRRAPDAAAIAALFERHLGEAARPCLTRIVETLAPKYIFPRNLIYLAEPPASPSPTEICSAIITAHDKSRTLIPALRDTFDGCQRAYRISMQLARVSLAGSIPPDARFSVLHYITPTTKAVSDELAALTDLMNRRALECLLPDEISPALSLYHIIAKPLASPTRQKLWAVFESVLLDAQKTRILAHATEERRKDGAHVISKADVEKLNDLTKVQRDLMAEIGGSPRAAKRLGFGSKDALSELIDAASASRNGTGPAFRYDAEATRAMAMMARDEAVGDTTGDPDADAIPEAEVDDELARTLSSLGEEP